MSLTDREIVSAVRCGDREAFGRIVRTYQGRLFGLVLMMVRQPAGAEEVTQDAFVRAYVHLHQYHEDRPFYPWLASIAVRLAQNWLRRETRISHHEAAPGEDFQEPGIAQEADEALVAAEQQQMLWKEVSTLPYGERTAVTLYYRDELGVGDVARALAVTTGTVKTLLFRARRHLRQRLQTIMEQEKQS